MIVLGYVLTAINYFCYCFSRFAKTKQTMLYWDLVAKAIIVAALYCLGSLSGSLSFLVSFVLLIVANIKEMKGKTWLFGYIFFQFLYILVMFLTYEGIPSVLIFITLSINLFALWWLRPQGIRMLGIISSIFLVTYQIMIQNWVGLLEIFVVISNATSFLKYKNYCTRYTKRKNNGKKTKQIQKSK